jgi:hypothetical protein
MRTFWLAIAVIAATAVSNYKYHLIDLKYAIPIVLNAIFYLVLTYELVVDRITKQETMRRIKLTRITNRCENIIKEFNSGRITRVGAEKRSLELVTELVLANFD